MYTERSVLTWPETSERKGIATLSSDARSGSECVGNRMAALLWALFSDGRDERDSTAALSDEWPALVDAASEVGAVGLLAVRLKEAGLWARLPSKARSILAERYTTYSAVALLFEHELRALTDAFDRAAIAFAPLKGARLLLDRVIGDPGARYMHDIDILTRRADRKRVDALLRSRGYVPARWGDGPKHLPPYRRGSVFLEVHEFAYWDADGSPIDLDAYLRSGTSLAMAAVHLLHHFFVSSVPEPALAIKTLWDFHELERHAFVPWSEVTALAGRAGLGAELDGMRRTVSALARGAPIAEMDPRLLALTRPLGAGDLGRLEMEHLYRTLRNAPLWYGARHALTTLVPSRASMETIHGLPAHSPRVFGAYAARPFRLASLAARRMLSYARSGLGRSDDDRAPI